jgi:uncharacterized protein YecE (DUF72 family)
MTAHVGTSGWAYKEWKPGFYPEGLPASRFLAHYASELTTCEINATFYRLQSPEAVGRWREETPPDFRFAVKVHRRLTHARSVAEDDDWSAFLVRFLASLEPLGPRLGALLVQFPPTRRRDDAMLDRVIAALPDGLPVAMEFRHESWDDPALAERVAAAGGTICVAEREGAVPERLPPGPLAYARLRADRYDDAARAGWLELLEREAVGRPVFVVAKHEGVPAGDPHVGVGLAQWLAERVGRP